MDIRSMADRPVGCCRVGNMVGDTLLYRNDEAIMSEDSYIYVVMLNGTLQNAFTRRYLMVEWGSERPDMDKLQVFRVRNSRFSDRNTKYIGDMDEVVAKYGKL